MVGERLRSHRSLVVVCTAAAVVEALLVSAFAPTSSLGLATQVTAPPPFGVFHDLRWIVVYHESWIGLACELLAFVVVRSLLTAVCLRAAWPHDIGPEPWAVTIRRSVLFTVIVGVLLAPWAALMFALAVVSLSWLFFVAIPVVLMLALLVHGGAVTGSWWRRTLSARSLGWVLVAFVALSVFGSIMTTCPVWARVPVAALAGCANAWLWLHVVDAVLHRRRIPRAFPVAPVGIAGAHVRQLAVLPLDTGVSAPSPSSFRIPYTVVPAFHGGMLDDETTASVVTRTVADKRVPIDDGWSLAEDVIQAGASAWQVPQLTSGINASWSHAPDPDNCRAIRAYLQHQMR